MPTPHNSARPGDFARTVLMPGDPLRAKYIAETFLEEAKLVNSVRGMLAYTGTYRGKRVSVMGSGMGMPSIGIYSYELYDHYGVETILRVGSTGSLVPQLKVGDIILVTASWSESTYARVQNGDTDDVQYPDGALVARLRETAKGLGIPVTEGCIHSGDVFYSQDKHAPEVTAHHCLAEEMESFALFHNAKALDRRAGCLLTVSDEILTGAEMSPEDRERKLADMIRLALEAAEG